MPISNYNYCNDKLKALIEEFGESAVKSAVNRTGIMEVDANVNKGLICHTGIGLREHNHTLHASAGFAGSHASFRMARDMGLSVDDSVDGLGNFYDFVDGLGNFYGHVRAESSFIKPSDKSDEFKFSFFEKLFTNSKLKNFLMLEKEKAEKYKELEPEDFIGLWNNHLEEDSEWHAKPYNIFRKRKGLPGIALEVGEVYFINLGKGDESRIVKMILQRIKNEDANFPELYFSLEDIKTLKHNSTHMNIGIFKVINKVGKNEHN